MVRVVVSGIPRGYHVSHPDENWLQEELGALKEMSYLINVGGGRIVNEPPMINAIEEGWIGGVHLDCHVEEPLRPDHTL